jgi:uncharacterized membrane protein
VPACGHAPVAGAGWKKTLSYAVMHLVVAVAVAFALTGDWHKALAIGIIEPIIQTFAFTLHDRWWSRRGSAAPAATGLQP